MKSRLSLYIALAMVAGPLFGMLLHGWLDAQQAAQAADILALITTAFLRLIKMIIAPLVFCTLTAGVSRMDSGAAIARVGARCIGWFIAATLVAMTLGLFLVQLFKPGLGMTPPTLNGELPVAAHLQFKDMLEHLIPDSIIQAMAKNEILQVVVFSLLFGTAAAALRPKTEPLIQLIEQAANVVLRMTAYIMTVAPLAVFAALAATVLTQGAGVLATFAKFIAVFYLGLFILWSLLILFLYLGIGRRTLSLAKAIRAPLLLAFSTASSEAAYPQTLKSLEDFGVSPKIAAFVLPMGYSFNLDGAAMYCTFAILFIAQIYRVDFSLHQQLLMVLILMVTSKGVAGVPRASLVIVAGSLAYFGLPEQGLVFIVAVDHLLDMGRTATNLIGNVVASCLVAKWEGELQESVS
jgi:Na+/H+-dicarboxylate symporter